MASSSKKLNLFSLLADSTRVNILRTLTQTKKICVGDLASKINLSLSATSHQLRKLEFLGVVEKCRYGQEICYCLNKKSLLTKKIMRLLDFSRALSV